MGDISYTETDATGVRPPGQLLEHGIGSASSAGSGATGACMSPGRSYIVTGPGALSTPHQKLQFPRHSLSCLVFVVPRIFALKQWLMSCHSEALHLLIVSDPTQKTRALRRCCYSVTI